MAEYSPEDEPIYNPPIDDNGDDGDPSDDKERRDANKGKILKPPPIGGPGPLPEWWYGDLQVAKIPRKPQPQGDPSGEGGTSGVRSISPTSRVRGLERTQGEVTADAFLERYAPERDGDKVRLRLDNFRYGIVTSQKRGNRPLGALEDCQNLVINKRNGALVQRHGYTSVIAASPQDISTQQTITSIYLHKRCATETPSADLIDVLVGNTAGSLGRVFQNPFWQNSNTATDDWVDWGEEYTGLTINGDPGVGNYTVTLDGGNATADYHNGWILFNETRSEKLFITDWASNVATCSEIVPDDWANNDEVTLKRYFHDSPTFHSAELVSPGSLASATPIVLQLGDTLLWSGGRSSTEGYQAVWSGFMDKTFFTGNATTMRYWGTYVTEAEIKSSDGYSFGAASAWAGATTELDTSSRWFMGFVFETDDGQFSKLLTNASNYVTPTTGQGVTTTATIQFPGLNKRFRYMHYFLGSTTDTSATTLPWDQYYYIGTKDLVLDGADFTYNASSGTAPGNYSIAINLDNTNWILKQENALDFCGIDAQYTSSKVSFSKGAFVNNRLFIADYYDYVDVKSYTDQIRYSGFGSNQAAQLNVLPNTDGFTQSTIEGGDPASIQAIVDYQGLLFIIKDGSCFSIDAGASVLSWVLEKVAEIGTDVPNSVVTTPFGVMWLKTGEDVYLWNRAYPRSMTHNTLKETFQELTTTNKANWHAWYDSYLKTYNFMYDNVTDKKTVYSMCFEIPALGNFAWVKHRLNDGMSSSSIDYVGNIFLNTGTVIVQMVSTALTDNGTAIAPYFDTGEYVLDERDLVWLSDFYIALQQDSGATRSNTLDVQILIDNSTVGSYTSLLWGTGATEGTHYRDFYKSVLPLTAVGRRIRFKFNTNATKATFQPSSATVDNLTINEVGFLGYTRQLVGDATHAL